MYRLRSIAPLVISTLCNGLWSDSRSGHFNKLCSYAPHKQQFSSHPVILGTSSVCFYAELGTHLLLEKGAAMTTHTNVQPVSLCPCVAATRNILVTQASYRTILAVNPAPKPTRPKITSLVDSYITHTHSVSRNSKRLWQPSQDTLLLKGTKH
jgi:hypothetical protein